MTDNFWLFLSVAACHVSGASVLTVLLTMVSILSLAYMR